MPPRSRFLILFAMVSILLCAGIVIWQRQSSQNAESVRFAAIGDFGSHGPNEQAVAQLVESWSPDFVISLGDNNYPNGDSSTIDDNIGQYYHLYINLYKGHYGAGASANRFFPTLGNHDWVAPHASPYLDFFTLPGNERYYDFVRGPVHFFVLDSDSHEPDGISADSTQATWLRTHLAASKEPWKLVYFHHPPFSSSQHGSTKALQWPFKAWGADAVLSGHDHTYERVIKNGLPYFVNGLGGAEIYQFSKAVDGSMMRYNATYGAMRVEANASSITFSFVTIKGEVIDRYTLTQDD